MTDAYTQSDDERRRDLLQVIKLYEAMTEQERYAEHYDHLDNACPIDQDTNDGQRWLGVTCPLCKDDVFDLDAQLVAHPECEGEDEHGNR